MTEAIAALGHLGLKLEESFASGGTINEYLPIISEDLVFSKAYSYQDRVMNTPQQVGGRFMQESVSGSITFPVSPSMTESIWKALTGDASSPYAPTRPLKSLALEVDRESGAVYASGDVIGALELSSEQGGELVAAATIEGKGFKKESSVTTPSFTAGDDPYLHNEASFVIAGDTSQDITQFSVNIDNQLNTGLYANQSQRRVIPGTKCVVTGSFTKLFQDVDELDRFIGQENVSIVVTYSRGGNSLVINIAKARLDSWSAPIGGQAEYILETFNFTGYITDPSSDNVITITVT